MDSDRMQWNIPTAITTAAENFQLNDKNLTTTLNRIKYDPELLIHYLFDGLNYSENVNIIKVCKTRVKKTYGTMLAHYYAHIDISNGYSFELHPGSQPKTFQIVHSDGTMIMALVLCDECCKNELRSFIDGENNFNVAFKNCESILCKRKSMQTVFVSLALAVIVANMFTFSWYFIFWLFFIVAILYVNNNYMISDPRIIVCPHKRKSNVYYSHDRNIYYYESTTTTTTEDDHGHVVGQ
ncbi:hypothetical protein [Pseudoplusia includens SNPV IE]|uniref:Ac81 n=2 Tax=Chrysodeixis includens nucleopolyhedrovirus TaxID=1207438 RepID=A0A0B4ZWD6_9ABAC|nr:hypothetical protein [Pseudoplusia includens SNPV IE]AJD80767.1 hypothetical protein [Pseudoplusia includens SNPV IE]AOL56655.1 hypothetical protein [Chrysodeixis includens nucleopolyhedrovirus]